MTIQDFATSINYPAFSDYFTRVNRFVNNNYSDIISFFKGELFFLRRGIVEELYDLIAEYDRVIELVNINTNKLSVTIDAWDILDALETVGLKLETIRNTPKWQRSSVDINFNNKQVIDTILKSRQTVEGLVNEAGSNNPDDDWVNVAVNNTLYEDDYTYEGEKPLKIRVQYLVGTTPVNSVDIMVGDNVLGKDLTRIIEFEEEDLKALTPTDTLNQSAQIILNVYRQSIPEHPTLGITKEQIGGNINSLQFPSLFRQVTEMFRQDDSFAQIEVINVGLDQDAFIMDLSITGRTGLSIEETFKVFDDTFDETFN
jgi:hypothetical protein